MNLKSMVARPPFIGLLAFLAVLVLQGLGHTQMILMEHYLGLNVYLAAFLLGGLGAVMLYLGMRPRTSDVAGTWLGFFAGTCLWNGWVEFSFVYFADHLGVPPAMQNGEVVTKPEYLVMASSVGILLTTLVYFVLNRETRCNFFKWFHRNLKLDVGKPTPGYKRNIAAITALETIYIIWFFYVALLIIYDEAILGDRHPVTYVLFFANLIWAMYLLQRLVRFWKVTIAVRYAIPTAIITWNNIEILGRWNFFTEIWVHPLEYWFEMSLIFGAFLIVVVLSMLTPADAKSLHSQEAG